MVTNGVISGTSQSFMLLLYLLDDRIAAPTLICFFSDFVPDKKSYHYWNYLYWQDLVIPDTMSQCIQKPRLFQHWLTVNWIGHYWSTNFTLLCRHLSVNFNSHTVTYYKLFVIYRQKAVLYYLKRPESLSLLVWNHGTPCFGDSGPSLHEWRNRNNPAL